MSLKLLATLENTCSWILSFLSEEKRQERDGDHSCLWLLMWSLGSQWLGEPTLTQKTLCTCCWNEGILGWEPPLLREDYCSQTNINQSHSCAECPSVLLRKKLKEKGLSVFEGSSTVRQTRRQSLWRGLGATFVAFQRSCERSGITKWPFHEITGNAGNSMFNQVWFVHKSMSWSSSKHRLSYASVTNLHRTGSVFCLTGNC